MVCIEQQSPNIADGVHVNRPAEEIGAGDQVFACDLLFIENNFFYKNSLN
jgi:S-adenosylmethionine synthetase